MKDYHIITPRLGLRNWRDADINLAHKMNSNTVVMEYFPKTWSLKETCSFVDRMKDHYDQYGFCYFAVDRLDTNSFIGFIGLMHQTYKTGFDPFIDIGWRLIPEAWGHGFATEGAQACLHFAFTKLLVDKVYAVAPQSNKKSQRVMQKIGMHEHQDFDHPNISKDDPLHKCIAYQIMK